MTAQEHGWGKKPGRGYWHYWKAGCFLSACSQEYHMGEAEFQEIPPEGTRVCKRCLRQAEREK